MSFDSLDSIQALQTVANWPLQQNSRYVNWLDWAFIIWSSIATAKEALIAAPRRTSPWPDSPSHILLEARTVSNASQAGIWKEFYTLYESAESRRWKLTVSNSVSRPAFSCLSIHSDWHSPAPEIFDPFTPCRIMALNGFSTIKISVN